MRDTLLRLLHTVAWPFCIVATVVQLVAHIRLLVAHIRLLVAHIRLQRKCNTLQAENRRLVEERVEAASQALTGMCTVDGINLPIPNNPGWKEQMGKYNNGTTTSILVLGDLYVTENCTVHVGSNRTQIPNSPFMEGYAKSVWAAFYSRVAHKAVEGPE